MRIAHPLALAALGWYLIMPPWNAAQTLPQYDAPIVSWKMFASFDTARECEKMLNAARYDIAHGWRPTNRPSDETSVKIAIYNSNLCFCISSDDPRLKDPHAKLNLPPPPVD